MTLPTQLQFIKSVRFWKLFIAAVLEFLASQGIVDKPLANAIAAWLAGSVVVRTVDRLGEKSGNNPVITAVPVQPPPNSQ